MVKVATVLLATVAEGLTLKECWGGWGVGGRGGRHMVVVVVVVLRLGVGRVLRGTWVVLQGGEWVVVGRQDMELQMGEGGASGGPGGQSSI